MADHGGPTTRPIVGRIGQHYSWGADGGRDAMVKEEGVIPRYVMDCRMAGRWGSGERGLYLLCEHI